tara:strand:- start:860 stop:1246 length:387 start_codon:yes stop_codon:yes gene_type:complete
MTPVIRLVLQFPPAIPPARKMSNFAHSSRSKKCPKSLQQLEVDGIMLSGRGKVADKAISTDCPNNLLDMMKHDDYLLNLKQVCSITAMSRNTVYRRMDQGKFPRSVSLGGNMVRWKKSDIQKWMTQLV